MEWRKKPKYHTVRTIPKYNRKIIETKTNLIPLSHTDHHDNIQEHSLNEK
jgi:hypothetical protein